MTATKIEISDDCSMDFGGAGRRVPARVCDVGTAAQVREAWEGARRDGLPAVVRGAGHSCNGQTLTEGVILRNCAEEPDFDLYDDGLVEASCRSEWYRLEQELNARGRAMPVLTDYLHLTVGGTLSVGGLGLTSVQHGMQVDQVERLRLIGGDGVARWCSRTDNTELFRYALGGVGQVGVLDRVVMRTVPYCRHAHVWRVDHGSMEALVEDLGRLEQSDVDHYHGYIHGDVVRSELGYIGDDPGMPEPPVAHAYGGRAEMYMPFVLHHRRVQWLREYREHVRMWADYVLDLHGAAEFLVELDRARREEPLRSTLKAVYLLAQRRPEDAVDFAFAPRIKAPMSYGIGLYTMPRRLDPPRIVGTRRVLRAMLERCAALGGRPYLYAANELDPALCRQFYGWDYGRLQEIRRRDGLRDLNAESLPAPEEA